MKVIKAAAMAVSCFFIEPSNCNYPVSVYFIKQKSRLFSSRDRRSITARIGVTLQMIILFIFKQAMFS